MSDQDELLSTDFDENYDLFIEEALATGCVWGLENDEGWALCPALSNEDLDVLPLWSQPDYAELHCREEWRDYKVVPISLEELLDDWLPGMHEDLLLVGPNWDASLEGLEVEPLDLLEDVDSAAEDLSE